MRKPKGWRNESYRHALSSMGVKTSRESDIILPGKIDQEHFKGPDRNISKRLYEMSITQGRCDDQIGSVEEVGWWYGLILNTGESDAPHAIVSEDDLGVFEYTPHETEENAREAWFWLDLELGHY